ncbi:MAG: zinc ABC transporter substrate-binding protein [Thermodesulfovibrionales bacterium]|nr:zinc ABC transporter substrate-binding protein [Thermodesulfovibrionales bacterium]
MHRITSLKPSLFVIFILIIVLLTACFGCKKQEANDTKKMRIITTLFPLYEFSKEIAGQNAIVELLLPAGSEPHSFEPKPMDIARLNNSDIFVYTGRFLEPWVDRLLKAIDNKNLIVIDASRGTTLLTIKQHSHKHDNNPHHSDVDPHIWLDIRNAMKMVDNIYEGIVQKEPLNQDFYKKNADRYKAILSDIDSNYEKTLSSCPKKTIISGGHHSFGYLAKRYNLHFYSAYGISPDSEPSPKTLATLSSIVKKEGLRYVVFEEMIMPRVANTIARETGAQVVLLRAGHNLEVDEFKKGKTFVSVLNDNLDVLKKVLQCP